MIEKQLASTIAASAYQKEWFSQLRRNVFEKHQPYAIVQADMPFELFQVMGVPTVSNQWWAALISAKRLAPRCFDELNARGFHEGLCHYCSLPLACTLAGGSVEAPWGGLPKPALLSARLTCDCIQRVFEIWSQTLGTEFIPIENPGATELPPRWWELSRHNWQQLFEARRLDLTVDQFHVLIAALERITERRFEIDALRELMEGVNRQEEYFDEALQWICKAPKTPVRMTEQITNVMAAQWLRGTDWAVEHAKKFRDEIRTRVESEIAACPQEKLRLMWVGAGLWHDTDFYTSFESRYGAVFVWSMYLAFGPDGYIRYGLSDPLRALASRVVSMNEQLHNPPWANEWIVDQAEKHRIDGAIVLVPTGTRSAASGTRFIERALEKAHIPVTTLVADVVDSRNWDGQAMRERVARFIEERLC
ncbi:MAG: 2-hydroxyacyl-CoA dehydratase [Terriglobia bacterium]